MILWQLIVEILTEEPNNPDEPVPDLTASEPNLDIVVNETIKYNKIGTTTVIDTDKNEEEGIFDIGDNYYKNIDIDVLLNGNDKIILNKGSKESTGNLTLGGDTNTLSLTIDLTGNENGHGQSQANGEIVFYNDGEPEWSLALVDGKYAYTREYLFDTFEVRHTGSSSNGSSSIHIDTYEVTIMQEVEPLYKRDW